MRLFLASTHTQQATFNRKVIDIPSGATWGERWFAAFCELTGMTIENVSSYGCRDGNIIVTVKRENGSTFKCMGYISQPDRTVSIYLDKTLTEKPQ